MQVILLEQIRRLGNTGDVVKVKDGFARNYLIPSNKAIRATKDNISYFESKKSEIEKENKKKLDEALKLSGKISGAVVSVVRQAGEDGRLFGSVSAADISNALIEQKKESIDRKQVVLQNPIKYIGVHEIELSLYADATATVHVNVARSASEAKDAAARFARGEIVMEGPEGELAKESAAEIKVSKKEKKVEIKTEEKLEATSEEKPKKKKAKKVTEGKEESKKSASAEVEREGKKARKAGATKAKKEKA